MAPTELIDATEGEILHDRHRCEWYVVTKIDETGGACDKLITTM